MQKLRIGDIVRIIHNGKEDDQIYTILDILEDYDGSTYWLQNERDVPMLEMETQQTVFVRVTAAEA